MIETPQIVQTEARITAVVHVTIPRNEIQKAIGPAIQEVIHAVLAQGLKPAGPVFSHHFRMEADIFDFEVGVPVAQQVAADGRVEPSNLPSARVARTIYQGPYEGLVAGWNEFQQWIENNGHKSAPDLWEVYVRGPETGAAPSELLTELYRPLTE